MIQSCEKLTPHFSAWIDGELSADENQIITAHILHCDHCLTLVESMRHLDSSLNSIASTDNFAAARLAESVLSSFLSQTSIIEKTGHRKSVRRFRSMVINHFLNPLLGVAAGFLIAWAIFLSPASDASGESGTTPHTKGLAISEPLQANASLARLVASTGSIEFRQSGQQEWSRLSDLSSFQCSPGSEIRTIPGVRCEVQMNDHNTIRLNETTELVFRSPREIELRTGQVWCSSTSEAKLQIVTTATQPITPSADSLLCFTCPPNGSLTSEVAAQGECRVQSTDGDIDVSHGQSKRLLKQGEIARFENNQLIIEPHYADSLLSTSWMQPLIVLKGHDSPELRERVNKLLANLGRSKMDHLYENEIRSLGEYAALPLLRFVQSQESREIPGQRLRAMSIIADIAPSWVIGDLIDLLTDPQKEIRINSATALNRLTGQSHGLDPDQWSASQPEQQECLDRWKTWWQDNSSRYELKQKTPSPRNTKTT